MISSRKPLCLAEVKELLEKVEETEKTKKLKTYIKKFTKKEIDEKKMKKELQESGILRLHEESIAKLIDIMPEDAEDVRKIFTEISLDENEISKILEILSRYR